MYALLLLPLSISFMLTYSISSILSFICMCICMCMCSSLFRGDQCRSCTSVDGGLLFAALLLSFLLVIFLLRSAGSISAAGPVVILQYFIQTAALEVGPVSSYLSWLRVVNLDASSTQTCIGQDKHERGKEC